MAIPRYLTVSLAKMLSTFNLATPLDPLTIKHFECYNELSSRNHSRAFKRNLL